jgi:ATP-GRASP peptide maturase of grasp-with-spasm system
MICILSQAFFEGSTEAVCEWLRSWNVEAIRLNADDIEVHGALTAQLDSDSSEVWVAIDGKVIGTREIRAVWYRKWNSSKGVSNGSPDGERGRIFADPSHENRTNTLLVYKHLTNEFKVAADFLFAAMQGANWLGRPAQSQPNKLEVLRKARACGFDIPATLVTSNPDDLMRFRSRHGTIVTKPLSDILICYGHGNSSFSTYTAVVPDDFIQLEGWKGGGAPSLFQEYLSKKYEVRTFYLDGRCYSMAMYTQFNESTRVDSRHYNVRTRSVPFSLNREEEECTSKLMNSLCLDTGSLDFVKTADGRFVFLEVNPLGQFGMLSGNCNYRLEEKVARALVTRDQAGIVNSVINGGSY